MCSCCIWSPTITLDRQWRLLRRGGCVLALPSPCRGLRSRFPICIHPCVLGIFSPSCCCSQFIRSQYPRGTVAHSSAGVVAYCCSAVPLSTVVHSGSAIATATSTSSARLRLPCAHSRCCLGVPIVVSRRRLRKLFHRQTIRPCPLVQVSCPRRGGR